MNRTPDERRKQLALIDEAVRRGEWRTVVRLSEVASRDLPRIYELRLIAYLEIGDLEGALSVARSGLAESLSVNVLTRMVGRLFRHGCFPYAAEILLAMHKKCGWNDATTKLARDVADRAPVTARLSLLELVESATRQVAALHISSWPTKFTLNRGVADGYMSERGVSTIRIGCQDPKVEGELSEIRLLERKYLAALAKPAADRICCHKDVFVNARRQIWSIDGTGIDAQGWPIPPKAECDALLASGAVPIVEHAVQPGRSTKGVFHWLIEDLPTISWLSCNLLPNVEIIVNGASSVISRESFDLFAFASHQLRHAEAPIVFCKNLYIPPGESRGINNLRRLSGFFSLARQRALERYPSVGSPKILISRRDSARRKLQNEEAFEAHFSALGYESVLLSKYPFAEQVAIVARASRIIATHGAGLSHLVFASPEAKVGEVMPFQKGHMNKRFNFCRISLSKGMDHAVWVEPINPVSLEWTVDIDACSRFFQGVMVDDAPAPADSR